METEYAENYLDIQRVEAIQPLDLQTGVWPKKTIPDELYEPLFGAIEPTEVEVIRYGSVEQAPPAKTYALLDAAKVPHLSLLLENADLSYKSLFKGKAEKDFKDVAVYLVELSEESDLTRQLFTSSQLLSSLWDKDAAVYLRSRKGIDELRHHFRKFMRLYSEEKKQWMLFRFYAPEVLRTIIMSFNEKQFEAFAKDISLFACRSEKEGFLVLSRSFDNLFRGAEWGVENAEV